MSDTTLYFAYASFLDPDRIADVAPNARFLFTAHFPEAKLDFFESPDVDGLPTLTAESGHTVWGGIFEIPNDEVAALTDAEKAEGRIPGWTQKAVDRAGNKHECLAFVAARSPNGEHRPSAEYLAAMVKGARHWSLPAGWVMGLEDLGRDTLLA